MSRGKRRWIATGSIVALAGLGWFALRDHGAVRRPASASGDSAGDRFQGFSTRPFSGVGSSGAAATPAETPEAVAAQVDGVMGRWRTAILVKDAPTVIALDMTFRQAPERFTPALAKSAETDDNERVRAFSTRVLGKLKSPDEAPLYQRLLDDKSPYVRQNAAWALGELGSAGSPAVAELQRASRSDPANDVRAAAKAALGKL
ncbi:MAG TPA: HEAT repeat domain-containing protein [Polyangia bacterium]